MWLIHSLVILAFVHLTCTHSIIWKMWLVIVSVLATFDIAKAKDKDGKEILIDDLYTETAVV